MSKIKNLLAASSLGILLALSARAEVLTGKIVGVSDGDTVTLLVGGQTQHRIRLLGIDAPESSQAFGQASKNQLSQWVFAQEIDADCPKTDRFNRRLCRLLLNGTDINLALVEAGYAWHYKQFQSDQTPKDRVLYAAAEDAARQQRVGLWVDPNPVPPWDFRRGRSSEEPTGSSGVNTATNALAGAVVATGAAVSSSGSQQRAQPQQPAQSSSNPPVKLSRSGICHTTSSPYYSRTTNFRAFPTLEACLAAGGRPVKR